MAKMAVITQSSMNVEVYNPDEDVESYPDLLGRDYAALLQRGLDLHSVRLLRSQHSCGIDEREAQRVGAIVSLIVARRFAYVVSASRRS